MSRESKMIQHLRKLYIKEANTDKKTESNGERLCRKNNMSKKLSFLSSDKRKGILNIIRIG